MSSKNVVVEMLKQKVVIASTSNKSVNNEESKSMEKVKNLFSNSLTIQDEKTNVSNTLSGV